MGLSGNECEEQVVKETVTGNPSGVHLVRWKGAGEEGGRWGGGEGVRGEGSWGKR